MDDDLSAHLSMKLHGMYQLCTREKKDILLEKPHVLKEPHNLKPLRLYARRIFISF